MGVNRRRKVYVGRSKTHRTFTFEREDGTKINVPAYEGYGRPTWAVTGKEIIEGRKNAARARKQRDQKDVCKVCAIALAAKRQMMTPFVLIGADHAYLAEVATDGIKGVDLLGDGREWIVRAYEATNKAREIIDLNDLNVDVEVDPNEIHQVTLKPRRESETSEGKAKKNATNPARVNKRGRRLDNNPRFLEDGVRSYAGRVWT
jgi:hypothetical protein